MKPRLPDPCHHQDEPEDPAAAGISRRRFAALLRSLGILSPFAGGLGTMLTAAADRAAAQGSTPQRFLQIFLMGGWDNILSTDPVLDGSAKAASGNFEASYFQSGHSAYPGNPVSIAGKSNLMVGAGLAPAAAAFAQANTAFINGMHVEVTAHELAVSYLYSGVLSLSRSREYPAIIATMADQTGGFPAHVILGGPIPLAATRDTNPPLLAQDVETFVNMLAGPYNSDMSETAIAAAHDLIATLNSRFQGRMPAEARSSLSAWNAAEGGLETLYAQRFHERLGLTPAQHTTFGTANQSDSIGAKLGTAWQVLKEGVSRYVTVNFGGFDTHQNHFANHLGLMQEFASRLATLTDHLATTNDPDSPSKKLLETTTVLITSEFNRTPAFNGANGTDHWQTGNAILMGKGVADNTVVGSTGTDGMGLNYQTSPLLPEHLATSILRQLGFTAEADKISEVHLSALFTP